jgi:hypothetical protein
MEILKEEFEKFVDYFSHFTIERIPFKYDENDPAIIEATYHLGPDEFIEMEGFHIYINSEQLLIEHCLNKIDKVVEEVKHNLGQQLIDTVSKKQLLDELRELFVIYESDIVKRDKVWISKKSEFKDCNIEDFLDWEIKQLSEFFLQLKYVFRKKIVYINNLVNNLKIDVINKISDKKVSEIGPVYRLPFEKIPLRMTLNRFVTFFYEIYQDGLIAGSRENLIRFLSNSFLDQNNRPISPNSVRTYLKPDKEDKRVSEDKRLSLPEE